jgi:ElaB/YqjD/DUF883 family membrane-anchored ribosome-binding protein
MDDEAEVIREEMLETRTAMTQKFEAIEDKLASAVTETTESVTQTVEAVKDVVQTIEGAVQGTMKTMTGAAEEAVESVKEAFDVRRQVERHPWLMFGGAVATGFAGTLLLERALPAASAASCAGVTWQPSDRLAAPGPEPSTEPGVLHEVGERLAPVFHRVKGLAIGAAVSMLAQMVLPQVPEAFRGQVAEVADQLTTALGGEKVEGLLSPQPRV